MRAASHTAIGVLGIEGGIERWGKVEGWGLVESALDQVRGVFWVRESAPGTGKQEAAGRRVEEMGEEERGCCWSKVGGCGCEKCSAPGRKQTDLEPQPFLLVLPRMLREQ